MLNLATSTWRNLTPQEDAYLNWVNNACVALADLPSRAPTRSAFVQLHTAKPQTSRIFEGEVKAIQDKKAWVTMTEHGATEPLIGTCDADTLAQNHIGIGDRFRFVIRRSNGELNAVFEKYPRGTADQSEVQRVQDKFADVTVNGS
jgi:hypothetical protein